MTDTLTSERIEALLPCPLCGSAFLMGREPHDNHPVAGMFYIYHDYGLLGSDARKCPLEIHRHFDSAKEATTEWNRRSRDAALEGLIYAMEKSDSLLGALDLGRSIHNSRKPDQLIEGGLWDTVSSVRAANADALAAYRRGEKG